MLLFEEYSIRNLALKNRIVMAPISTNLEEEGFTKERMIRFFEERAKGGVGLITVGDGIVDSPVGNNVKESMPIDDDRYIKHFRQLTDAVKRHGTRIALQISHAGRRGGRVSKEGYLGVTRGQIPVAPSPIPHPVPGQVVPRELTRGEIKEIVAKFGDASRRAIEAGFDAIGLHCAHMYLCGQFLSPWANQRTDEYGGSFEGRLKFVLEVIDRIRSEIGEEYPLIVRMNGEEPDGGNSLDDIREIARRFEQAGVDAIHVSVGFGAPTKTRGLLPSVTPMRAPHGCIVHLAENVKKAVSIRVIAVSKLGNIPLAEKVLQEGKADMIAMARPLIADPYLPNKASRDNLDSIRPCISCCQGCIQNVLEKDAPIACSINPVAGREVDTSILSAKDTKKVLIMGGGPAGMQAAETAAVRGHQVYLIEKGDRMGGQLCIACKPPGKKDIEPFTAYLIRRVTQLGVQITLKKEASSEIVEQISPDIAVIAIGSAPTVPPIPGLLNTKYWTADQVLDGASISGKRVVIIGGGRAGCEVAEFLSEQGKDVTIIEMLDDIAPGMDKINRLPLIIALEDNGVKIMTKTRAESVSDKGVWVDCLGSREFLEYEELVVAAGREPRKDHLADILQKKVKEIYLIGDSVSPRNILEATHEGFEVATQI